MFRGGALGRGAAFYSEKLAGAAVSAPLAVVIAIAASFLAGALAALLFLPTRDPAFLGFLGFLVFLRYFWVNPDELFLLTLRQAATAAFVAECTLLGPLLLFFHFLSPDRSPMPQALGLSFGLSLILFCLYHSWLEWKEAQGSL